MRPPRVSRDGMHPPILDRANPVIPVEGEHVMPRMTGAKFMVQMMQAYGVTHAFYMPMVVTGALVEMEKVGIRRIMTHGEKAAAYMADGYARAAHRAGICMAKTSALPTLLPGCRTRTWLGRPSSPLLAARLRCNSTAITTRKLTTCSPLLL